MDNEDLAFIRRLSISDKWGLFLDAQFPLFKVGFLISMVDAGQDDVLGSGNISREWDKMEEKY